MPVKFEGVTTAVLMGDCVRRFGIEILRLDHRVILDVAPLEVHEERGPLIDRAADVAAHMRCE